MNLKVAYTNKSVWPVDWSHSLYDNSAYRGAIQIRKYIENVTRNPSPIS